MDLEEKHSKEKAKAAIETAVLAALAGSLSCDEVNEVVKQAIDEANKFLRSRVKGSHHAPNFNIMGTESFRFRCDKPNIVKLPCKATEAEDNGLCPYPKSPEYKHRWKDLTRLEKVLSHLIPIGKLNFSCWDNEEHRMIPIIRRVTDEKDRKVEDKITYIVNETNIDVWTPEEHITYGKSYILDLMSQYAWDK